MWQIAKNFHTTGAIEVFEHNGTPVLITHIGRYPTATDETGRSTHDVPHILISISGGSINAERYWDGVIVDALGQWHNGRRRHLPVFRDIDHASTTRRDTTPDRWVAIGKMYLDQALAVLESLDRQYETAAREMEKAWQFASPLDRQQYEAACKACAVETLSDVQCRSYGVRFGDFCFPTHSPSTVAQMHLARLRLTHIEAADKARTPSIQREPQEAPAPNGQLWEPCEQCGAEPSHLPLHLCAACWPAQTA